eukprot:gb/GFBE01032265.1/.p1 GENE.gb/GFBE01032265.1/~~gb/GFBE01032265.1/.p1  ORF type:complete len:750 (+),score=126.72 gb/GFBE01032265.1/:1-2250(+)
MRPINVLCEEERLRRLSERMCCDTGDGAEPARQKRAQSLVPVVAALAEELQAPGCRARRAEAVRVLEAGLEARWRLVLHDIRAAETMPAASVDVLSASAREVPRMLAPVPAPSPEVPRVTDPQEALSNALDFITVRSVVSFRGLTQVSPGAEIVTVAVLRLAATGDAASVDAQPLNPPKNWDEARRVLLKPGHFVSSLRKYPYAAERGQVSEADLCFAEEALAEVPPHGDGLAEVHETALQLYDWLRAALEYAAWARARLQDVASPARATRAPVRAAPVPDAYPASEPASPPTLPGVAETAPADLRTELRSSSRLSYAASPPEKQKSTPSSSTTTATSARSPSPKLLRRPPGSAVASVPATSSSMGGGAKSAGFNVSWSSMAATATSPGPGSSLGARTQRSSVSGVSPRRRASPSPVPVAAFAASPPKQMSSSSTAKPGSAMVKSALGSVPARTRQSVGGGIASPTPATRRPGATTAETQQALARSARSPSSRSSLATRPRVGGVPAARATSKGSTALTVGSGGYPGASSPALPTPEDFATMRVRLEQEKKEVKQIRALESQLKWGLEREEKRQTEEERREEARQIMEWRDSQAKDMKEYVEEKTREQRVQDLMESKQFQEFKREWKQAKRAEEIERIRVQLAEDMDNAHWQVQLQQALELDRQLALQERLEAAEELRELKEKERAREKEKQNEERAHDLALDYAHQAYQINAEKEELMRNLQLLRTRMKAPVAGNAARTGGAFWPSGR